jgi:hypothetical protein
MFRFSPVFSLFSMQESRESPGNVVAKALVEETMLRILLLGAVLQVSRAARNSVISNIEPRRDTKGAIIDAHDGNVVRDPRT